MLHIGPRPEFSEKARLGLVVAKKFVRQAVRRNTIKRIAREQFRLNCAVLPRRDLIIRLMRKFDGMPRKEIATEIVGLLKKVRP
jgi:ribonuclease P protein component